MRIGAASDIDQVDTNNLNLLKQDSVFLLFLLFLLLLLLTSVFVILSPLQAPDPFPSACPQLFRVDLLFIRRGERRAKGKT
jgi:hypothetical protein